MVNILHNHLKNMGLLYLAGILWFFIAAGSVSAQGILNHPTAGTINQPLTCANAATGFRYFDSGGAGGAYQNNETGVVTFTPPPGYQLEFTFNTAVSTEAGFDFFTIFNGPNVFSPVVVNGSGAAVVPAGQIFLFPINGAATFRLTSDFTVTAPGWDITVRLVFVMPTAGSATLNTCCGRIYDPGWRNAYQNNNNFTLTVTPTVTCNNVSATFVPENGTLINAECCCDRLGVFNGPNVGFPLLGNFNSCTQPPATITSSEASGALTFRWTSDFSVIGNGFIFDLACVPKPPITAIANASPTVICQGNGTTLLGSSNRSGGTISYQWTPGPLNAQNVFVTPAATTTYTVRVVDSDPNCPGTATAAVTVTVNPRPTFTTAANSPLCEGSTLQLEINNCVNCNTFSWAGPGGFTSNLEDPIRAGITVAQQGIYSVTVTSAQGCTNSANVSVTVFPRPTVAVVPTSATICEGNTTTLTASGANFYDWQPGNLIGTSVTVSPAATQVYTVVGTDAQGCTNSATATVNVVLRPPLPTLTVFDNPVCLGRNNAVYTVAPDPLATGPYIWNVPLPAIIVGPINGNSITVNWGTTPAGTYPITVTPQNAGPPVCAGNTPLTLNVTVDPIAAVNVSATPAGRCPSDPPVQLLATGYTNYTWTPATGLSSTTIANPTAAPAATTTYTVNATDAQGCRASGTVEVVVFIPPTVTITPNAAVRCQNDPAPTVLTGNGAVNYSWQPGGLSGPSISVSPLVTTTYTVVGTDGNGCTGSATATITVNNPPTVSILPLSQTICAADPPATLTASGAVNYLWQPGALNTAAINVNPGVTTTYTVTGTDANGCTNTATAILVVTPNPPTPVLAGANTNVCLGQLGVVYSVNAIPGTTFNWTIPGVATLVSGQGTPAVTVNWVSGGVPAPPPGPYTITVTATNTNCTSVNALSIDVNVIPIPATPATPVGPSPVCRGGISSYNVPLDPNATSYTWSGLPAGAFITAGIGTNNIVVNWGAAAAGTYVLSVVANNCSGSSPAATISVDLIDVRPQPSAITPPANICVGQAATFSVINDPNAVSYTWSNTCNWANNGSTTNTIDFTPTAGGPCVISVFANNQCGQSLIRSITVTPVTVPAQPLPVAGVTTVCPNQVENYSVPNVPGVTYTWGALPAGANYVSGQGTNTVRINWGTATAQSFTLTVTPSNACGNGTDQSIDVLILERPAAPDAIVGPTFLCVGQSGSYSVFTPVPGVNYTWSVSPAGPSLSPSGSSAQVVFTAPGTYTLNVTSNNQCGAGGDQALTVTVNPPNSIVLTQNNVSCNPTFALTATPAGGTWACVSCPGGATVDNFGNVSGMSIPGGVHVFSYTVVNPPCASAISFASVRYDAAVGGSVGSPQTICSGGSGNVSLTGQNGNVIRWERSTDCVTYSALQNTSNTLTFINLTQNTCFRAVVQRGTCPSVNSSPVQITVIPRVTANATPATQSVCVANATVTGNLPAGTTGNWSFVSGPQVANIVTAGVNGNITGMSVPGTYVFRWTLQNPPCAPVTADVTVTRVPALTVPNAGNDQTVCADRTTLVGNIPVNGTAVWSVVSGSPTPTLTNVGQNVAIVNGMTAPGIYVFRYTISSPNCGTLTDDITVDRTTPPTVATAGLDQTTCDNVATVTGNTFPLTGTGAWSFISGPAAASITTNFNIGNISGMTAAGTYCFRWTISNPPCAPSTDDVCITVTPQPSPAQVGVVSYNLCDALTATLRALRPQSGVGTWSFVSGPATPTVATQGTDGLVTGLTAVGSYIFRWTVTSPGCAGTSSVDVTVNREASITENISAGPNQVLCNVTTTTLNSPTPIPPRSVGQWVYVSGPVPNVTVTTSGTTGNVINMDQPGIYIFEWRVRRQTGSCPSINAGITVEIKPNPTPANAGADQTLCATTATLTGNVPMVGTGAWTQVSGPSSSIVANNNVANISGLNQNATYCYRWTIANAPCTPSSDDVCLNVSNNPVAGNVTGNATVCTGTNTGTLTLTGHSGSIIRWESSTDNFGTFSAVNNTNATFTFNNLTTTTSYRAVLRNGTCPEVQSGFATVTVRQTPSVANAGADREFCGNVASTTLTGNIPVNGTPVWVFLNGPATPSTSQNGNLFTVSGLSTPGTYCFQYRIENAPCAPTADDVCITIFAPSNGGTAAAPATVCTGVNNGVLTLTGFTGAIQRWEFSTNSGQSWLTIQQATNTLSYLNLTQSTLFRAVVKNGICPEAFSNAVLITVSGTPSAANAGPDQSLCGAGATSVTLTGNIPQNGTGAWTFVAGPIGASPSIVQMMNVANVTNMLQDGIYVFRYTVTNSPCPAVFDDVVITRFNQTLPGILSTSPLSVCAGNNSGTLTVAGNNGTVVRWEQSTDNFASPPSLINVQNTNLPYTNLTQTTQFRAVIRAGVCAEAVTNVITINVVQPPSQANGGPNQTVCGPDVTLNGVAPGFGILTWSVLPGAPSPVTLTPIGNRLDVTGMVSVGTYIFRATVSNPPCQPTTADVIVTRLPNAPVANAGPDVTTCATTVTLNGSNPGSGTPTWTQQSGPVASIVPNGAQATLTNLTVGTYVFRYSISQAPCPISTDDVIVTVVAQPSAAQVSNQNVIVCDANTTTIFALPPVTGMGMWSVVSGGVSITNPNSPNTTVTGINANGTYVVRWTVTNPPCNTVNTVDVVIVRQSGIGVVANGGANQSVCNTQFATLVGNQPPLGSSGQWAFVSGPAPAAIITAGNFGVINQMSLPGVYSFSWTITPTNGCPATSSIVTVTRVSPPTVANAGPVQSICGNSVTITGNTPMEGTGSWTFVSGPSGATPSLNVQGTTLTATALDRTGVYIFRWTVANAPCTPSAIDVPITVFEPTESGTLQGEATVCSGNNNGSLNLVNFRGTIIRWERSTDNFNSFTLVNNVSPNLPYSNLTQNTCWRVVVKNGSCPEATSNIVCVTVVPPVTVADAGADQTICDNNITLSGNVPVNGMPMWTFVSGPSVPTLTPAQNVVVITGLTTAGNYLFRYTIDNTPCGNSTDLVQVTVNGASNAGTLGPNATVCSGTNSGTLTLTGFTGQIVRWESSNDGTFSPANPIANTTAVQSYANLTQAVSYRAVVRSGQCAEVTSNVVMVDVRQQTVANAGPAQNICGANTATVNGNTPNSGTGTWSFVSGPVGGTPSVTTSGTTGTITNLNVAGVYTFRWTILNPPCAPSSSTTTVSVSPLTVGGSVSTEQTVCGGINTGTLVLTGAVGNVLRWESSTDNFGGGSLIIHQNPTPQHTFVNLTQTTWYRAVVQSGTCASQVSSSVKVTVVQPTVPANAGNNQTVCTSTTTLTGNVPNSGTPSWTFVVGPVSPTVITSNNTATVTGMTLPGVYVFRYSINNPPCQSSSANVQVTVLNPVNTGTVSVNNLNACQGGSVTATLTGNNGAVVRWETSTDGGSWNPIANVTNTLNLNNLTGNTVAIRAVINGGVCGNLLTAPVTVNVNMPPVAGMVMGAATVCAGNNAGQIVLTGQSGTVVRWEQSVDGGNIWTTLVNNTATQLYNNLTQNTAFRAVIGSGACPTVNTGSVLVTMAPASVGGTVANNLTVCAGQNSGTLSLAGNSGAVVRWESSLDGLQWNAIANTTPVQGFLNLTQTTRFRVVVQNGNCAAVNSSEATVTVTPNTVAGTASAPQTVCSGSNTGTLNLTGNVGNVVRWEVSTDGGNSFNAIPNSANVSYTFNNLTQSSIFRAVVQNGNCNSLNSNTVLVTVEGGAQAGVVNGSVTLCSPINSGTLTLVGNGGTIVRWESSVDNGTNWNPIANTTATQTYTNVTQTTIYRAVVTSQLCGGTAFSQPATVSFGGGSRAGFITGNTEACGSFVTGILTLNSFVGNVIRWEVSNDNQNFTSINNTTSNLSYSDNQNRFYRAVVQNGNCPPETTASVPVRVFAPSNGGTVSPNATVCSQSNSGVLTVSNNVGAVGRWEQSIDGGNTWTSINVQGNTLNYSGLTQTTRYRAVVQNGVCPAANSTEAVITVVGNLTMNVQPVVGCSGSGSIFALASGGSGTYTYSVTPPVAPNNDNGQFTNIPSGNYTVNVTDGQSGCTVSVQIFVPNTRTAPVITAVNSITLSSAVVTWPAIPPGVGVTYSLRYRILGSQTWTTINNIAGTSQLLQNLQNNTTYEVQLSYRCGSEQNSSPFSTGVIDRFTTLSMGSCSNTPVPIPGGFYLDQITNTTVRANWNRVPGAQGYIISWGPISQNVGSWVQTIVCDPQQSFTITGLNPNTAYGVRIRTNCSNCFTALNNGDRRSNWSIINNFITPAQRDLNDVTAVSSEVQVYPNPNNGLFNVSFEAAEGENLTLSLYDVTGKSIMTRNFTAQSGKNEIPFELSGSAAGVYMLRVVRGDKVQTTKIVLQ